MRERLSINFSFRQNEICDICGKDSHIVYDLGEKWICYNCMTKGLIFAAESAVKEKE